MFLSSNYLHIYLPTYLSIIFKGKRGAVQNQAQSGNSEVTLNALNAAAGEAELESLQDFGNSVVR